MSFELNESKTMLTETFPDGAKNCHDLWMIWQAKKSLESTVADMGSKLSELNEKVATFDVLVNAAKSLGWVDPEGGE